MCSSSALLPRPVLLVIATLLCLLSVPNAVGGRVVVGEHLWSCGHHWAPRGRSVDRARQHGPAALTTQVQASVRRGWAVSVRGISAPC